MLLPALLLAAIATAKSPSLAIPPQDDRSPVQLTVFEGILPRDDDRGPDGARHWYAYPWGNLVMALFYRKDLFQDAGLDPEKPPRDWNEMLAMSRRITNPEKGIFGMGFGAGVDASWNFYTLLCSAGAR